MPFTYLIILAVVLVISPFVLKLASNKGKKTKQSLKSFFILILSAQIILGFLNWETFKETGKSGFGLAFTYPQSFLGLFFIVSIIQLSILLLSKKFYTTAVILNFINTVIFFIAMIRLGQITGIQAASFANIGAAFAVLIGNIIGLIFINKDKNLLKKYPFKL